MNRSDIYVLSILTGVEPRPSRFKRSANEVVQCFYDASFYVYRTTSLPKLCAIRTPKAVVAVDADGDFHIVQVRREGIHEDPIPANVIEFIAID